MFGGAGILVLVSVVLLAVGVVLVGRGRLGGDTATLRVVRGGGR